MEDLLRQSRDNSVGFRPKAIVDVLHVPVSRSPPAASPPPTPIDGATARAQHDASKPPKARHTHNQNSTSRTQSTFKYSALSTTRPKVEHAGEEEACISMHAPAFSHVQLGARLHETDIELPTLL
eukprot:6178069-Pleurochrysis_carterae.AAC.1